ncbi:hypothetical protein [Sigmofec virus UA08Rod_4527]|uniref:Uncharacterized protein n=1 Tax=Sigmofec virus UA08Rod_4527 TaxID=2929403 RepID=A0A976N236_9VIRU|nr:hypothetical protein [Sigmofec virus UA08Rod_4527]
MNSIIKKLKCRPVPVSYIYPDEYIKVEQGLSVSPSQVAELTAKGIPVSSTNVSQFIDGSPNPSFDLPIDELRGVDINDVWEASKEAARNLSNAQTKDINDYGV